MLVKNFCSGVGSSLPGAFLDCLPKFCGEEKCGYPMEISDALMQLNCSNPRCPSKIVQRLLAIARILGINDLHKEQARKFVAKFGITNPLFIFGYEPESDGEMGAGISLETSQAIVAQFVQRNKFTVSEYVSVANLPFIQTSVGHIFSGYDDLAAAYRDIESGGVDFIQRKLGVVTGDEGISVRALRVYESLMQFKGDLFDALSFVEIQRSV